MHYKGKFFIALLIKWNVLTIHKIQGLNNKKRVYKNWNIYQASSLNSTNKNSSEISKRNQKKTLRPEIYVIFIKNSALNQRTEQNSHRPVAIAWSMGTDACLSAERPADPSLRQPPKRARTEKKGNNTLSVSNTIRVELNLCETPPTQRNPCCAARKTICWSHLHAPKFLCVALCASAFALRFCIIFFFVYWINVCDEYI